MAETLRPPFQLSPAATTLSTLYTVPAATTAVVSSVVICNQNATAVTFRISLAVAGAADDPKQYLYYDQALDPKTTFIFTIGTTLGAADVVRVWASATAVSFNLFVVEES